MIKKTSGHSVWKQHQTHLGERERLYKDRPGLAWESLQFQTKKSRLCSLGPTEGFSTGLLYVGIGPQKIQFFIDANERLRGSCIRAKEAKRGGIARVQRSSNVDPNEDRHQEWRERRDLQVGGLV